MMRAALKASLIGAGATVGSLCVGCALLLGALLALPPSSRPMTAMIFWPLLVPLLLGGIVLGLWLSHRFYRRTVAHGER
ncbi:hypothetical protein FV230_24460 [Methylobacterium sp. WL6]|nr:hypothetical protein FV230_24460 [Methylobacterium sp. WL6]